MWCQNSLLKSIEKNFTIIGLPIVCEGKMRCNIYDMITIIIYGVLNQYSTTSRILAYLFELNKRSFLSEKNVSKISKHQSKRFPTFKVGQ